jgi:hypothetical protein
MSQNTISLSQAQEWAQNWRNNPDPSIIAFLIPRINITQLIAERETVDIRSYLGIDNQGKCVLMIVGVDQNGKDLIDDSKGQYIYDFTRACQPHCDLDSPLFTL